METSRGDSQTATCLAHQSGDEDWDFLYFVESVLQPGCKIRSGVLCEECSRLCGVDDLIEQRCLEQSSLVSDPTVCGFLLTFSFRLTAANSMNHIVLVKKCIRCDRQLSPNCLDGDWLIYIHS